MKIASRYGRRKFYVPKIFLSILFIVAFVVQSFAQQRAISGKVVDGLNQPVPNVSIVIKGTKRGTTTNDNGAFTISVLPNDVLVFSSVGYGSVERKAGQDDVIDVSLSTATSATDEVVVVGYGTTSRKNLTTSVAKVDPKKVPQAANNSIAQLLTGRAAGLTATQNSSEPGGNISVSIRGRGNPLVVVDGAIMPYTALEPGSGQNSLTGNVNRGGFAGINPNDVESIEFLKDASAAIYGVNASNGVMLITTKKGKGGRVSVTYDGSHSLVKNYDYLQPLNAKEYMTYYNQLTLDKFLYDKKMAPFGTMPTDLTAYYNAATKPYTQAQIDNAGVGTDWLSYMLKNGSVDNHNVSISGASDKVNYYFSGGVFDQKGSVQHSDLRKYTARLNVTFNVAKFLSITTNINGARNNYQNPQAGNQGGGAGAQGFNALQASVAYPSSIPVYDATGKYSQFGLIGNPRSLLDIRDNTVGNNLFASFAADFKIIPNMLSARLFYSNNSETADRKVFLPSTTFFDLLRRSRAYVTNSRRQNQTMEATINFKKKVANVVNIDAVVGTGQYPNEFYSFTASGADMLDAIGTDALGASSLSSQTISSSRSGDKLRSYFGRANFDVFDRYVVSLSARYDGYSQFFPQNKYDLFPSASLGWKITNEQFMKNVNFINFLKLRGSIGVTGNASGYAYGTFTPDVNIITYNNGATTYSPYYLSALDNPNLRWPKTINKNIGLDFGLFRDRITGSLEWFRDDLTRFVVSQTTAPLSLISTAPINTGHQVRQGLELSINMVNIRSKGFEWTSFINLTHNTLRWEERYANSNLFAFQNPQDLVSSYYVFQTNGILKDIQSAPTWQPAAGRFPGYPVFVDQNDDKKLDAADVVRIDPSVKLSFGFGNTFRYKNFDLDVLLYGQVGGKGINNNYLWTTPLDFYSGFQNSIKEINQVWTTANTNGTRPGVAYNESALGLVTGTDIGILSTNFIRCRNITLGYNLNSGKLTKYVRNLRVFADAQNPFVITDYPVSDPELSAGEVKGGPAPYPMVRTFSVGVKASF